MDRITPYANSMVLQNLIQQMQSQQAQLTTEISSGAKANPAGSMGTAAALLYQLHLQNDQQTALQTTMTTASERLDTMQTAMTSIASVAQSASNAALNVNTGTSQGMTIMAATARSDMSQIMSLLNTQYDGHAIFAGSDSAGTPMKATDASGGALDAINNALNSATGNGSTTIASSNVSTLLSKISDIFNDNYSGASSGNNFTSAFYTSSDTTNAGPQTEVLIGSQETLKYNVKGDNPAFKDLLHGLSMLSLLDAPSSQIDDTAKSQILTQAQMLINQGQAELTTVQGVLGTKQSQLQRAQDIQKSASDATLKQITNYEQADTYTDAQKLTSLSTQLQATYEITASLAKLSLSNYISGVI
ncbi:MAG TPA: flagellin [Acetobacteraceae bacterium]|nr:flagellin [Acetobacteraceae bacterium]